MNIGVYGAFGEKLAQKFLKKAGYKILATNYQKKVGEVDIIAIETKRARKKRGDYESLSPLLKKEDVIIFVEVKSRKSTRHGEPADAVGYTKKKHYDSLARTFFMLNPKFGGMPYRFDIIEVVGEEIKSHLINAF